MKEVRPPKRPLIFYYCVAMLILLLFNFLAMPWMARQQIQEVDYGTFMDMAENQDLGQVETVSYTHLRGGRLLFHGFQIFPKKGLTAMVSHDKLQNRKKVSKS